MATRQVLADLADLWQQHNGPPLHIQSIGGVDAERRIYTGERFDLVFLSDTAIGRLHSANCIAADSQTDLMRSPTVIAIPQDIALPDISNEAALRATLLAAPSIGMSTGPSGVALNQLFVRWGIADALAPRLRQAPPGVPVGGLIASGEVALGFQQLSELIHIPGITIVGPLPAAIAIETVFSGAVTSATPHSEAARTVLAFMASPAAAAAKQRQGMQPL